MQNKAACASVLLALCSAACLQSSRADAAGTAAGREILGGDSYWRFHVSLRKPVAPAGKDGTPGGVIAMYVPYRAYPGLENLETPPPAADWTAPDFDDADWPRALGRGEGQRTVGDALARPGVQVCTGLICLRGKFAVSNPAAVGRLELSLAYRGGVLVYLNGREVARGDLPAGPIEPTTPGAPYPDDAWLDSRGQLLPPPYYLAQRVAAGEKDLPRRVASRDRSLGPIQLPRDALRRGVNVLAVEIHRSDYHAAALQRGFMANSQDGGCWVPGGLLDISLKAAGAGATPNVRPPKGLRAWNHDVNDRVSVDDWGDPNEPLRPIELSGAKNGEFSGEVVVGATDPIQSLRARAGDLKAATGAAAIPASQVRLSWPVPNGTGYQRVSWFDGLAASPPDTVPLARGGVAVQPVWLTVRVPRDAAAGDYAGTLTLSARGAAGIAVPVRLHVADWTIPDPRDFRTYVGIYQSPTTLALKYDVPEWGERHWRLMERSFALLGRVGSKIVNIPLVERTQFGNDEGMLIWVRGEGGSFTYDFTVLDRYLDLTAKYLGVPDVIALQVFHVGTARGGWSAGNADQENKVTVLDRRTGRREHMQVPTFGTAESKAFWKPVLDAVRQRLAARGMDKAMCLGILGEGTAPEEVFRAFDEIIPGGANWTRGCHGGTFVDAPYYCLKPDGGRVALHEFCYGMVMADPAVELPPIWRQRGKPGAAFIRHNGDDSTSLLKYRTFAERALYCRLRGIGRTGLDYWPVLRTDSDPYRSRGIFNRWPNSTCEQRGPNMWRLSWPGPDGAEPTCRFQQLLEGIQTAEAMIVVAEAQGEHAGRIGPELAARCRQAYVDRLNFVRRNAPESNQQIRFNTMHTGWREIESRIYGLAAEVAAAMRRN